MKSQPLQTIPLHGMERLFGTVHNNSCTIAATMHVDGPVKSLLDRVPHAFANTMNKHPRMRVKQDPSNSTQVFLYPPVSVETVKSQGYVKVVHVGDHLMWQQHVQHECHLPFDRSGRFPYYLHVLVDPTNHDKFSLVLFCDHYHADGAAASAVLDSVLQEAAANPDPSRPVQERPLPESLHQLWTKQCKWKAFLGWILAKLLTEVLLRIFLWIYKPLFPVESTQRDVDVMNASVTNRVSGLWHSGTKANMSRSLERCREEQVTLYGAFIASIVAVFAETTKSDHSIRINFSYAVNARNRLPQALLKHDDVGCFACGSQFRSLAKGIPLSTRFWDVARDTKQETETNLYSFESYVRQYSMDEYANLVSMENKSKGKSLVFPKGLTGDALLSNMGRYPYPVEHQVMGDAAQTGGAWRIKNYFIYCSAPTIAPGLTFWMTCVGDGVDYSLMHKLEEPMAQRVFAKAIHLFEHISDIGHQETLAQVVQRIAKVETQ